MRPVPRAWLEGAHDLAVFDRAVCRAHEAPANADAYHQWHYAVDEPLVVLVNAWHATRQCMHVSLWDTFFDTHEGTLHAAKANLRLRQNMGHSERVRWTGEGVGEWLLHREVKRTETVTLWEIWRGPYVERALQEDFHLPVPERGRGSAMSYCRAARRVRWRERYQPKHDGNPRWWIEETQRALMLVVEADPAAHGWDSDDDEVIEYDKGAPDEEDDAEITPPRAIAVLDACRACQHTRRPPFKDGHGHLLPHLPLPVISGNNLFFDKVTDIN